MKWLTLIGICVLLFTACGPCGGESSEQSEPKKDPNKIGVTEFEFRAVGESFRYFELDNGIRCVANWHDAQPVCDFPERSEYAVPATSSHAPEVEDFNEEISNME